MQNQTGSAATLHCRLAVSRNAPQDKPRGSNGQPASGPSSRSRVRAGSTGPSKCVPTTLYLTSDLVSRVTRMASKFSHAVVLSALLLVGGPLAVSLFAEDEKRWEANPLQPGGSEIAFEWQYSCPNGKGCSFNCPGAGGGSNVTTLAIHLGTIPLRGTERAFGIFYEFSTMEIPRANGFSLTTGISTLSCQVSGMNLDYSGPPKDQSLPINRPRTPDERISKGLGAG
jgi:hypothetical protein